MNTCITNKFKKTNVFLSNKKKGVLFTKIRSYCINSIKARGNPWDTKKERANVQCH